MGNRKREIYYKQDMEDFVHGWGIPGVYPGISGPLDLDHPIQGYAGNKFYDLGSF